MDGVYNLDGTQNGKNRYLHTNSWHSIEWTGSQWIFDFGNSEIIYTNSSTSNTPPATGWSAGINSCSGSAAPTLTGVVPVELISFDAKVSEGKVFLSWQTASELNNEKFEIQEGQEFQKIGEVKGEGTTFEQQEYSFEIKNPRNGVSYYRLKQIDYDGQFEYSKVVSVNFSGENKGIGDFYPNPSKSGMVNLNYLAQNEEEVAVFVFDVTGKLVVNQIQQVSRGDNNLSFDFSDLNTGIYVVKIGDKINPTHRKLIIE